MTYYERTCSNCGFSWPVSSVVARKTAGSGFTKGLLGLFRTDRAVGPLGASVLANTLGPSADSLSSAVVLENVEEALRHCPACENTAFTQRRVRGRMPAS